VPAYIAVGSNLDDPEAQVRAGIAALRGLPDSRLVAVSALLRNPALGREPQPDYINAVAGMLTRLAPAALLEALLAIEARAGRRRADERRWAPRTLDLDLLIHGEQQLRSPNLILPHPGIAQRNFVLFPLLEIAPGLHVPGLGPVATLAAAVGSAGLVRVSPDDTRTT
jgi:2-amino-4-hydroxy-6-hydroxymethyldihydropteridine diphosphokinase